MTKYFNMYVIYILSSECLVMFQLLEMFNEVLLFHLMFELDNFAYMSNCCSLTSLTCPRYPNVNYCYVLKSWCLVLRILIIWTSNAKLSLVSLGSSVCILLRRESGYYTWWRIENSFIRIISFRCIFRPLLFRNLDCSLNKQSIPHAF